ncbi:MAG TPA: YceI family protein [Planctomycetota bacterium]|nr:YceI family protein [Planctomycetota bacterium]
MRRATMGHVGDARGIGRDELKGWIDAKRPFVLLDVLPPEVFRAGRVPSAVNACIYEVTFLEQAAALVPDRRTTVVTYCEGPGSRASADAAERLVGAGYEDVRRFEGGREAWREAGWPFEGRADPPPPEEPLRDGAYAVDVGRSLIGWVGRNPGGSHDGTLRFKGGRITVEAGAITEGEFEIDMRTIEVADLSGEMAGLLRRHLESEDFFAIAANPVARFTVMRMVPIGGATPGAPNFEVEGDLHVRGVTNPTAFPATVGVRSGDMTLEAHFDIDRTRWNVNYGSGKLYARLGMHLVHDHVTVQARVVLQVNG